MMLRKSQIISTFLFSLTLIFISLFFLGCQPQSADAFQRGGQKIALRLAEELAEVHTRTELIEKESTILEQIDKLVDLMIAARRWQNKHRKFDVAVKDSTASERLKQEMIRVYEIEGCQELFELWQREALNRLDAFEQRNQP